MTIAASEQPSGPRTAFPIVAVGCSAGGLEASMDLLGNLPAEAGVAIILLQHLDPNRDSSLPDLLSRITAMRVEPAAPGVVIEKNCVYVIPSHGAFAVEGGRLQLSSGPEPAPRMPIDRLFRSLARDRGGDAIAVLLSGTGSDGTLGIQSVKAEGGTTFAQDDTATYVDMPRAAAATGAIDFVLPPEQLAQELVRLAGAHAQGSAEASSSDEDALAALFVQLRDRTSVDFSRYKRSTLLRRVRRRVRLNHLTDLAAYVHFLEAHPEERDMLCEDVLIHVTNFFRDADAFDALSEVVFPKAFAGRTRGNALRVWVPGCSSGEEVYSIAICLLEFLESSGVEVPVKLFGTDVSASAIERARLGRYSDAIAKDVSSTRLRRFFVKVDGGYQIGKSVRDLCVFAKQDITRDPPFSKIDLVSCRNLMIYLGKSLQDRVLATIHFALKESGFLMLGAAESVGGLPGFVLLNDKGRLYAKTPTTVLPSLLVKESTRERSGIAAPSRTGSSLLPDFQGEVDRLILKEYAPSGVVVNDALEILHFSGQTDEYVGPAPGSASLHLLRVAREDLRFELRHAIDGARDAGRRTRAGPLHFDSRGLPRAVEIDVIPFALGADQKRHFLVLFADVTKIASPRQQEDGVAVSSEVDAGEGQLREQLAGTRGDLQSLIAQLEGSNDELRAANQETLSTNEELRSTNDELQATKEEVQATNEELITVNDEMQERSHEASRLNDDLTNVLSSAGIPILILDRELRVRRFTPAAAKLWRLIATDVGRPITDIRSRIDVPDLVQLITSVLEGHGPTERTVMAEGRHWFHLTVRPYLTLGDRIDGVVVSLFDVDALKQSEELLAEARDYAENIVDTLRESLLVLDEDLRVHSANRSFYRTFRVSPEETERRHLEELGNGQWNIPAVRRLLDGLRERGQFEDLRIDQVFPEIGRRLMLLNGRRIVREGRRTPWFLLAIEDITQRAYAEEALQRNEKGFRDMLASAAEAIVMVDKDARIAFANAKTCDTFGYDAEEIIGLPIGKLLPDVPLAPSTARHQGLSGRHKNGTEIAVEVGLSAMSRAQGQLVVAFITDITFRKRTEASIREYQVKLQSMAFDAARSEQRERRRIAADLHDRIGQMLALTQIKLASARDSIADPARATIDECLGLIEQSVQDTRTLTFELSPPVLYDLGLKAAVTWLAERLEQRYGIHIVVEGDEGLKLADDEISALLFRAVQELLTNVLKHAHASSARVSLQRQGNQMSIEVADSGIGFDTSESDARVGGPSGFGLFSVREQIARLGGTLSVVSTPHQGTRVSLLVPFAESPAGGAEIGPGAE